MKLGQPLPGEKYVTRKERKKRKIIQKIVDTTFHCNAQWQRTHFARTKILEMESKPNESMTEIGIIMWVGNNQLRHVHRAKSINRCPCVYKVYLVAQLGLVQCALLKMSFATMQHAFDVV